jgi:two-component system, cell cycle response regulator
MKILVADDDAVSRRLMEEILRRAGYEITTADNGRQALEKLLSRDGPRLALLDWMMPDLDGPEICLELRSHRERAYTYITLLTSKEAKEDLVAGLEAGADDYLTKPCNSEELKARLRTGQRILRLEDTLVAAREEMRFKATHDPLTSLWNRGAILAHLNNEICRVQRDHRPFSLLLCDVDYFKKINDAYGHPAGDLVLREIAMRLSGAVRPGDTVGRYGGEEFLVLLNDCGQPSIRLRAEQLRQTAGSALFDSFGRLSVSMSVGAMVVDQWNSGQSAEALLSQADIALYRAKTEGRNRTVIAESQPQIAPASMEKPRSSSEGYGRPLSKEHSGGFISPQR